MIDLRNIAQQLRLPADQLRLAADLLEQGYQPAFIARHRADETGHLPGSVLWAIKFAIEREHQLSAARAEALAHLGEGVELDEEARQRVEHGQTIAAIDVAMRCFRSRKAARLSGERAGQPSQLLEKMIAASGPVGDLSGWVAGQMAVDPAQAEGLLQQASRLVGTLLAGDTRLFERMRQAIEKKATIRVEHLPETTAKSKADEQPAEAGKPAGGAASAAETADAEPEADAWAHADDDLVGDHEDHHEGEAHDEAASAAEVAAEQSPDQASSSSASELTANAAPAPQAESGQAESGQADSGQQPISLSFESAKKNRDAKLSKRKAPEKATAKSAAKLTPRQRRRRWLGSVLQPLKSLKKPLNRLTAYQMLMIGRGQRSQLIKVELDYDRRQLVNMARDVFVPDSHPLAKWFAQAAEHALAGGLYAKAESDALAEQDELAQQKLLEAATDQLRASLLQRPVKGHRILVIDTVGPNSACVAVVDARGKCVVTQEVVCTALPSVVSQNVIMLGELVHKHKVTLVAISNGPARRFLIHTLAELMRQSAGSNLRWTMVDRGGAEAYATSKQASIDFPQLNRRFRAAVWLGRRLQDPLGELLKLDPTRLRLGSYQRELPQEPLKRLVTATLSDCLCVKGVDARYASEQQFSYVPGVTPEIATRLSEMASKREFSSREALCREIPDWPENGRRQALGFIRIFQSPQTLDGTLIHPDDYRLAQRILENTELTPPPAAPEGWQPPKVKAPKPPKASLAGQAPSPAEAEATAAEQALADTGVASSLATDSQATDTSPAENLDSDTAASQAPAAVDAAALAPATDPTADSQAAHAQAAHAQGETASAENDPAAPAEESPTAAASQPEYSEDVVTEQATAPPVDAEKLAKGWQVGRAKVAFLANCLAKPFSDSRDRRPSVPMLTSVPTLADLQPGMSVYAIVVGVAEFGAFVELGPDCGGLIHISRLSADYVEDPHQAVQIGDLIQTWVVSVDAEKKRVALTALSPEQQRRLAEDQRQQEQARRNDVRPRGPGQGPAERGSQERGQGGRPAGNRSASAGVGAGNEGRRLDRGGDRPPRGGGQGGGRGDGGRGDGGRGRGGRRDESSRPVVVKSKKPSAPITEAMKKGQEPLRSFSDLLQFYEVKRTDTAAPPTGTPAQESIAQSTSAQEPAAPPPAVPAPAVEPTGDTQETTSE